jgi:hypothetical protein
MSDLIEKAKQVLRREAEYTRCAECGRSGPPRETHTFLFCTLYKLGWSREQVIANAVFTVDTLRERREVETE